MIITLDTSALFRALYSKRGASFDILQWIGQRKVTLALTVPVFFEYEDVLSRLESLNAFALTQDDVDAVLDMLVLVGVAHNVSYLLRPNLPDEGDNLFVECAFVSQSEYLITNNTRDFVQGELKLPFEVCTPREFYHQWRHDYE
ncbi:MAG: putative nucleic acid-binding protein [Candidatus Latescibacterota bacterium]|jgi:predicted nucleic acid-binding protein